jgi:hypothetical protein
VREPLGLTESPLQTDGGFDLDLIERPQAIFEPAQPVCRIVVPIEKQSRVGGMVVTRMECLELLVGQIRDVPGISA